MKLSRYSIRVDNPDKTYLLYNTFFKSLALVDSETDSTLQKALSGKSLDHDEEELIAELTEEGIVRPDEIDEDKEIREWYNSFKQSAEQLHLIVLTTNACNMACAYCFEAEALKGTHMSDDVAKTLVAWSEMKLDELKPESMSIRFFGGEPFLNHKGLLGLAREFHQITQKRGIKLVMAATTNGTYLPRELIAELAGLGLESLRITLDGDEERHNEKRPLKNGKNGFKIIWDNLLAIHDLVKIDIAVNAEPQDEASIGRLLPVLSKSPIRSSLQSFAIKKLYPFDSAIGTASLEVRDQDIKNILRWKEMAATYKLPSKNLLDSTPCQVRQNSTFTIDPKGDIYACDSAIGQKNAIVGSIFEDLKLKNEVPHPAQEFFSGHSPLDHPKCKTCSYFPICGGGCRFSSFTKNDSEGTTNIHCPGKAFDAMFPQAVRKFFDENQ